MASSEVMTSSTHSFVYSYRLVKKCFVKICETSKCHNFLIFQPIFIRFSLLCSGKKKKSLFFLKFKLNLFRISPYLILSHEFLTNIQIGSSTSNDLERQCNVHFCQTVQSVKFVYKCVRKTTPMPLLLPWGHGRC